MSPQPGPPTEPTKDESHPFLTVPEVAELFRCSARSVLTMIARGDLEGSKIAGRWLVTCAAIADYITRNLADPAEVSWESTSLEEFLQ